MIGVAIYDRFIQRKNQLLINYPLIGRLRYFFYLLRNPMRQYFGDETYYDSFEKLDWINKVSRGNEAKRSKYLVIEKSKHIAFYHHQLLHGVRSLLAVMGKKDVSELSMDDLMIR